MRKLRLPLLATITIIFAAFTLGFFLGRNQNQDGITVSVPAQWMTAPTEESILAETIPEVTRSITFPVNINSAGKEELMALPGIGEVLAVRILTFRDEHGTFEYVEELLSVEGIGEKRLEEILELITVGG